MSSRPRLQPRNTRSMAQAAAAARPDPERGAAGYRRHRAHAPHRIGLHDDALSTGVPSRTVPPSATKGCCIQRSASGCSRANASIDSALASGPGMPPWFAPVAYMPSKTARITSITSRTRGAASGCSAASAATVEASRSTRPRKATPGAAAESHFAAAATGQDECARAPARSRSAPAGPGQGLSCARTSPPGFAALWTLT